MIHLTEVEGRRVAIDSMAIDAVMEESDGSTSVLTSIHCTNVKESFDHVIKEVAAREGATFFTPSEMFCLRLLFQELATAHGEDAIGVMMKHGAFYKDPEETSHITLCQKIFP